MSSLIVAVRFLTIVPVPGGAAGWPAAPGRAAWWFPAVGLALGAGLALADRLLEMVLPGGVRGVLVAALWALATGALHHDGLADCLDGLGAPTPERRLQLMRDGRIGVFGALGLVATFALTVAALVELPDGARAPCLAVAPAIGRLAPLLAALSARPGPSGLGAAFATSLPRRAVLVNLGGVLLVALAALGPRGAGMAAASLAASAGLARWFARGIGGVTGDVLGASVIVAEVSFLVLGAAGPRGPWR